MKTKIKPAIKALFERFDVLTPNTVSRLTEGRITAWQAISTLRAMRNCGEAVRIGDCGPDGEWTSSETFKRLNMGEAAKP